MVSACTRRGFLLQFQSGDKKAQTSSPKKDEEEDASASASQNTITLLFITSSDPFGKRMSLAGFMEYLCAGIILFSFSFSMENFPLHGYIYPVTVWMRVHYDWFWRKFHSCPIRTRAAIVHHLLCQVGDVVLDL